MRRIMALLAIVALLSIGLIGAARSPHGVLGQAASPSPEEGLPEGISFGFIATGPLPADMEVPAGISMFRIYLDGGSSFPIDPNDPTTALAYVEQGTLTVAIDKDITVLHAGPENQEPTDQDFENMAAGQQFTMTVGDSAVFPAHTSGTVSNDGTEQVVLLVAELEPPGYEEGAPSTDDELATPSG